jgi:hypothetical protein
MVSFVPLLSYYSKTRINQQRFDRIATLWFTYNRNRQNHGPSVAVKTAIITAKVPVIVVRFKNAGGPLPTSKLVPFTKTTTLVLLNFPAKSHSQSCKNYSRRFHRFQKVKTMTTYDVVDSSPTKSLADPSVI